METVDNNQKFVDIVHKHYYSPGKFIIWEYKIPEMFLKIINGGRNNTFIEYDVEGYLINSYKTEI